MAKNAKKSGVSTGQGQPTKKSGTPKKAPGVKAGSMHVGSTPPSGIHC